MTSLKQFIKTFDSKNHNWDNLPEGFPNCNLDDLSSEEILQFNIIKTFWEIDNPPTAKSRTRVWKSPQAYKFLVHWSNLVLLRILIRKVTVSLPQSEYRLKNQSNDASRSAVSTLEEGWKRPTTKEYLDFLGFTQGSLEEIKGDTERMLQDDFIKSIPDSKLADLGIDLKEWNDWAKNPANSSKLLSFPLKSSKYRILKEIRGEDITYEMLIELCNKTDFLLRKLVESLEKKLNSERKGYQVEQARIRGKIRGN
jgi:four helix bundle protein